MKQTILVFTVMMATSIGFAHGLTQGNYKGQGLWKSATAKGNYQATMTIAEKSIQAQYNLADGSTKTWNFDIQESTPGFFNVMNSGLKIGSGYCLDKAPVCHYQISVGQLQLEETLVQQGDKVYRFGSKDQGQGTITWQESFDKE